MRLHVSQTRKQEFPEGVRRIALRVAYLSSQGAITTEGPRSPGVFGAKSCNLAISRHFIQTFGKPCFPLLIFKDFHQILHQLGL